MKYLFLIAIMGFAGAASATQFTVSCPMNAHATTLSEDILATGGAIRFHGDYTSIPPNNLANIGATVVSSNGTTVDLKCKYKIDFYTKQGFAFEFKKTVNATSCVALGGPFAPPYTFSCVN